MSELLVSLLRLSYLVVLWLFVLGAIGVLRRDIYGTKVIPRRPGSRRSSRRSSPPASAPQAAQPAPVRQAQYAAAGTPTPAGMPALAPDAHATEAFQPGAGASPTKLVITQGALEGTVIPLNSSPILIGRHPSCTLVLDDDYSSNQHARIYPQSGSWYLEDLGSTNGTYLGRDKVSDPVPVRPGEPIRIGRTVLELQR